MSNLWISESHVNKTENHLIDEIPAYETWANESQLGDLYRSLQKEYGRCISSMYIDHTDRVKTQKIGWVFLARVKYDDCKETFLHETWIAVYTKNDALEYVDLK